jgi:hypothetical protein
MVKEGNLTFYASVVPKAENEEGSNNKRKILLALLTFVARMDVPTCAFLLRFAFRF